MIKKFLSIVLAVAVVFGMTFEMGLPVSAAVSDQEAASSIAANWMKFVDGDKYISQINIPGTHDAGTKDCAMGQCQGKDIAWQLDHGVRFLDIRILIGDNDLRVYHGKFSAKLDFKDVMQTMRSFLEANPSECVVMSIKNEGDREVNGKYFEKELENNYINNSSWSDLFYTSSSIPKLDDVRGKIVLVRRYGNSSLGLNATGWSDNNKDFAINRSGYKLRVQDYYEPEDVSTSDILTSSKAKSFAKDKWSAVSAFDDKAKSSGGSSNTLWINFTSGSIMGTYTDTIAGIVNPQVVSRLNSDRLSGKFHGIIAMDWVGDTEAQAVYMSNQLQRTVTMTPRINDGAVSALTGVKRVQLKSPDTGKTYSMCQTSSSPAKYEADIDVNEDTLQLVIDGTVYRSYLEVDQKYNTLTRPYLYQVRYESGGNISSVPVDNKIYQRGDTVTVDKTKYTKSGKTFQGWTLLSYITVTSFTIERGDYVLKDWWTEDGNSEVKSNMTLGSRVYTVSGNTDVVNLRVNGNAIVNVLPGVTLTCSGSDGNKTEGGKAGIYVPQGSSITFVGGGKVIARGGKGGAGSVGKDGADGVVNPDDYDGEGGFGGGRGGDGGAGGGGAGAGIGTDGGTGGAGGSGGAGAEYSECIYGDKYDKSGSAGSAGKDGNKAAACGSIYNDGVTLEASGGASGNYATGGYCGDYSKYQWKRYFSGSGGGGGGGGGGGCSAPAIGTGGSGGAGGGGGGGGGRFTSSNGFYQTGGEGGKGGKSNNNSSCGIVGVSMKYDNYASGTTSRGAGGAGGSISSSTSISAGSNSPYIRYTISFNSYKNGSTPSDSSAGAKAVYYGKDYGSVTVPTLKGYVFEGFWTGRKTANDNDEEYFTGTGAMIYDKNGKSGLKHAEFTSKTLYASWRPVSYTIRYDANYGDGTSAVIKDTNRLYGKSYSLRKNTYERRGYRFLGWSKSSTATAAAYSDGAAVKNMTATDGEEITLYAVWQEAKPTAEQIAAAKAEVANYKNKSDYRQEQQQELEAAIAVANQAIDAAATVDELNSAVANAKEVMDMIKTDAEFTAEENAALAKVKADAKAELARYKNMSDYREQQQAELKALIESGNSSIDEAADAEEVTRALADAKAAMDSVRTSAQVAEDEAQQAQAAFEKAKSDAVTELENYKNASDYRYTQRKELSEQIGAGKANIEAAENIAAVERALANAKSAIDRIKTSAQLDEEESLAVEVALANAKINAKASLESYRQISDYRYAERKLFKNYLEQGIKNIDSAISISRVDAALKDAQCSIDQLKTNLELDAEEEAAAQKRLADARTAAIAELESYADTSELTEEQQQGIADCITAGIESINASYSRFSVEKALAKAKVQIDALIQGWQQQLQDMPEAPAVFYSIDMLPDISE